MCLYIQNDCDHRLVWWISYQKNNHSEHMNVSYRVLILQIQTDYMSIFHLSFRHSSIFNRQLEVAIDGMSVFNCSWVYKIACKYWSYVQFIAIQFENVSEHWGKEFKSINKIVIFTMLTKIDLSAVFDLLHLL